MSPKDKQPKQSSSKSIPISTRVPAFHKIRDGLGAYISRPESYPPSIIVYYNDDFVALHDKFPKSSLHLLLLPRDPSKFYMHPFDAFDDAEFLNKVRPEVQKLRTLAAAELRRKIGKYSAQEKERQEAIDQDPPVEHLPPGRDWEHEIMAGIHAHPSMNHLHIHVLSVDRYSDRLKHRKHYNSFSTPFFVGLEDFPLAKDDVRRHPGREGYLKQDFICWRCGRNFKDRFQKLKTHLEMEYEEWKTL
jgi:aprataxin